MSITTLPKLVLGETPQKNHCGVTKVLSTSLLSSCCSCELVLSPARERTSLTNALLFGYQGARTLNNHRHSTWRTPRKPGHHPTGWWPGLPTVGNAQEGRYRPLVRGRPKPPTARCPLLIRGPCHSHLAIRPDRNTGV